MARDTARSQAAWEQFYGRHVEYLYFICRRAFADTLGLEKIEDLVNDAFIRAYQKSGTFKLDSTLHLDIQRKAVRAWLGKICANLVHDSFRDEPMVDFVEDEVLEGYAAEIPTVMENGGSEPPEAIMLGEAMRTLTDREQQVLRTTAFWYRPGAKQQRCLTK